MRLKTADSLNDNNASYNKNDVNKVSTKPTPFAALDNAIFLYVDTAKIFIVFINPKIPTPYKMIIGKVANNVDGSKNQNKPTPSVYKAGKTTVKSVASNFIASYIDQTTITIVRSERNKTPTNLLWLSSREMLNNPVESSKDEIIKRVFLGRVSISSQHLCKHFAHRHVRPETPLNH